MGHPLIRYVTGGVLLIQYVYGSAISYGKTTFQWQESDGNFLTQLIIYFASLKVVGNEKEWGSGKWQMIDIGLGLW